MSQQEDSELLDYVEAGRHKIYRFYDYDEFNVKFVHVDYPDRYILIQKQALRALASVVDRLANQFTK